MKKRSIPSSLAPVLEELELERPTIVTKEMLGQLVQRAGLRHDPDEVATRLQTHGWLLTLRTWDSWEFAPASRTGPIGSGDPFIELRATLLRRPTFPVVVAYDSAVWLHKLSQRMPNKHVLAIPSGESVPHALRIFRVTRRWGSLGSIKIKDLPVWQIETLIVMIGAQPLSFRDWPNMKEWLNQAFGRLNQELLLAELDGRPRSTWMRTGYLLETGGAVPIAEHLRRLAPRGRGPFYLGRRQVKSQYNKRWEVVDSLLRGRAPTDGKAVARRREKGTGPT
ncbi:MAG: type IV toxin-antitoxin system AbiEi family antitoxin [Gemmatimonadota bacterium]